MSSTTVKRFSRPVDAGQRGDPVTFEGWHGHPPRRTRRALPESQESGGRPASGLERRTKAVQHLTVHTTEDLPAVPSPLKQSRPL